MQSSGFADWTNPTEDELRRWAYDTDATRPEQDWDIIVARPEQGRLYIEVASDERCPHREFFLHCLYLLVGDAVRTKFRAHDESSIRALIAGGRTDGRHIVAEWADRADALISNPSTFDYASWCDGGLARAAIARQDEA